MSEELKACPFCGEPGQRKLIKPYRVIRGRGKSYLATVGCSSCTAIVDQAAFDTETAWKYAADRWTRRAPSKEDI